jgi:hypothetical protein
MPLVITWQGALVWFVVALVLGLGWSIGTTVGGSISRKYFK